MKNHISSLKVSALLLLTAVEVTRGQADTAISTIDEVSETVAIMKVIDNETKCFFEGDYECWASNWSHENYAVQAWNNSDGTADVAVGWEKINAQGKNWIETYYKNGENIIHPEYRREKPIVKFFDDHSAYLVWKQYNADSKKTNFRISQETRVMEKDKEGWKIVNVSALWDTEAKISYETLK